MLRARMPEGTDTVSSTVTFSLAAGYRAPDAHGDYCYQCHGQRLRQHPDRHKNILTGGGGNDTIIAGGGADTMLGGTGDDLYIVSVTSSVISESASEAHRQRRSSVTYTLSAEVENLTLTAATAINGTGNGSANILIGGTGNNALSGGAGTYAGWRHRPRYADGRRRCRYLRVRQRLNIDVVTDFSSAGRCS